MLADLIEAHKNALAEFEKACDDLESMTDQYEAAQAKNPIKVKLHDVSLSIGAGREWLVEYVDEKIDKVRRQIPFINSVSSEFADRFDQFLEATTADLYAKIDQALIDEERRAAEFGLTEVREEWDRLSKAESECLKAISSYICADHDEERARLLYLMSNPSAIGELDDLRPLLLQSVAANHPVHG